MENHKTQGTAKHCDDVKYLQLLLADDHMVLSLASFVYRVSIVLSMAGHAD